MVPRCRFISLLALCFLLGLIPVRAQEKPKEIAEPKVPLQQWLEGPERSDIRAEFKVLSPRLSYLQRYLVECRASISGEVARGREFHIWTRVADSSGKWLPGGTHEKEVGSPALGKHNEVQYVTAFYAVPGQYKVGFVLYDPKSREYDVRQIPVTVKPIESDPLASELVPASPPIEFLSQPPPGGGSFTKIGDVNKDQPDSLWPFARRLDTYKVDTSRLLQIDVVLNLSDAGDAFEIPEIMVPRWRGYQSNDPRLFPPLVSPVNVQQRQKEYIGTVLSVAQVLGAIHPSNGCVRISALDILNMEEVMNRMRPETVEWEKVRKYRTTSKLAEVSVNALKNRKEQPIYVRDYLTKLQSPIPQCGTGSEPPIHVILFVSRSYVFPDHSKKPSFKFPDSPDFRFYHYLLYAGTKNVYDDLGAYLKSAGAKSHDIVQPRDLRELMSRTFNDVTHAK